MQEPLDALDDAQLVERIDRGDGRAFEVLHRRHRDRLYRIAWRFTRDPEDAFDVLQEALSYFLGRFPGFRLRSRFVTFLHPVLRHLARDLRERKERRRAADLADFEPCAPPSTESASSSRAELARVLRALSEGTREVVLMRFVDDLSLSEIAEALAIPLGTVKSRLHEALSSLRSDPATRHYFDR